MACRPWAWGQKAMLACQGPVTVPRILRMPAGPLAYPGLLKGKMAEGAQCCPLLCVCVLGGADHWLGTFVSVTPAHPEMVTWRPASGCSCSALPGLRGTAGGLAWVCVGGACPREGLAGRASPSLWGPSLAAGFGSPHAFPIMWIGLKTATARVGGVEGDSAGSCPHPPGWATDFCHFTAVRGECRDRLGQRWISQALGCSWSGWESADGGRMHVPPAHFEQMRLCRGTGLGQQEAGQALLVGPTSRRQLGPSCLSVRLGGLALGAGKNRDVCSYSLTLVTCF